MSRHKTPRDARRRLMVAAVAATAIVGTAVTVGVIGVASAGEKNQAASEQCVSKDQNGEQQSNLPRDNQNAGNQGQDERNTGGKGRGGKNTGDQQQPRGRTYGLTAPLAAYPGSQVNENDGGRDRGGRNGGEQNGDEQPQCVGPFPEDFVDITTVEANVVEPRLRGNASTGTFVSDCGNNEELHQNTDNIVIAPGTPNGAEHLHDYVGNLDTTFASTEESLAAAETTCDNGDLSTYFWPILRNRSPDDGFDRASVKDENNIGEPVLPADVLVEWRGNPTSEVVAAPRFLRLFSGDAKTITNGLGNARPTYTCTGFEDRIIDKYPLCPDGSNVVSIHDYPGCWDGENVDSENHRDHLAFADEETGACPEGTVAIPQLRVTLTYGDDLNNVAQGFAVDGFSTEEHDPASDHAGAINVMPEDLMEEAVDAINDGKQG
jgi:hypothetical protein